MDNVRAMKLVKDLRQDSVEEDAMTRNLLDVHGSVSKIEILKAINRAADVDDFYSKNAMVDFFNEILLHEEKEKRYIASVSLDDVTLPSFLKYCR